ncbi:MAG: hypothetical protein ACUVSK_08230 [Desulfotomaculales bacterium]
MADGTIIRLHDKLAEQFPGARGKAELKIHTAIGITGNTRSIAIYSGKTAEIKTMRIGSWVKDNILSAISSTSCSAGSEKTKATS